MKQNGTEPSQAMFHFAAQVIPQGDGNYLIKPGKPVEKLAPKQFAAEVGYSRGSIYRRIQDGSIPQEVVEYIGPRKILIHARALDLFRSTWKKKRAGEI